jgi:2-methylisocitrate lyase-like PEP mutase family enzyme
LRNKRGARRLAQPMAKGFQILVVEAAGTYVGGEQRREAVGVPTDPAMHDQRWAGTTRALPATSSAALTGTALTGTALTGTALTGTALTGTALTGTALTGTARVVSGAMPKSPAELVEQFRALHVPGRPLLLPNPWDQGTARVLAHLGFAALATTSSGHAGTLGRLDGSVTRAEALAHAASIASAVDVPVSADLENGFTDDPAAVADTVAAAAAAGLAGCSIEDFTGDSAEPIYDLGLAADRVAAAAQAAHAGTGLVLTARAENYLHGRRDLIDTIRRLHAFQEAGADVLYAPGLRAIDDIRRVVASVDRPVNVLAFPGAPTVAELAAAGVARVSVGGAFSLVALGALVRAGRELLERGTYSFLELAADGRDAAAAAFAPRTSAGQPPSRR